MDDVILIVLGWRRPDYLRQCLQSWGMVRGARSLMQVTVRLGRSDPDMEGMMRHVAETDCADAGLRLELVMDDPEDATVKGPDLALGKEIDKSFARGCKFVLECDEDVIVSDDALEYVAWAREQGVDAVCLHNALGQGWLPWHDDSGASQSAVRIAGEFTSWCFGFSEERWRDTWRPSWDWRRGSGDNPMEHGWEWQMHRQANSGLRLAIPDASRCQNIGEHGGTFSVPSDFPGTISRSFRPHREPVRYLVRPQVAVTLLRKGRGADGGRRD